MRISTLTLFPDLYKPFIQTSLIARAVDAGIVSLPVENLFSFVEPKKRIDSPSFGHGAGMLLRPEILEEAIAAQEKAYGHAFKIFFSPQGKKLDQNLLKTLAVTLRERNHMMLIPARYEGMDARVEEEYADCVLSIGDYVLMGGDIPAMAFMEGILRLIPGVVGKETSVEEESFSNAFIDYPEYTAPVVWRGKEVPEVVRSGNHEALREWRKNRAAQASVVHHFQWVRTHISSKEDKQRAARFIPSHYVVLMHDQVLVEQDREGTSSLTSLDIHDIARSSATYGIKNYFIVTPLKDQQKIAQKLLTFWNTQVGIDYNPQRHHALASVRLVSSINDVQTSIQEIEESKPIFIATSAKEVPGVEHLSYFDQEKVWKQERPVVIIFGTARGLAPSLLTQCDYVLGPIGGFADFNHLSVRSAAAVILDRWLGINPF